MTLRHDVDGHGPTLVLIHGVVHRRQAWDAVLAQLTPYRRVVTVDLPGHGESGPLHESGENVLVRLRAEVTEFVRDVAGSDATSRPHVAGNSLGGYLALCLAAQGDVTSATALSPAGFFTGPLDQARTMAMFRGMRSAARLFGSSTPTVLKYAAVRRATLFPFFAHPSRVPYDAAVADASSLTTNAMIDAGIDAPFEFPDLARPPVPMTVAWGTRDLILPRYQMRNVRRQFPHARVIPVPGVGHVPMTDNPDLVASILLAGSEVPTRSETRD